MPHNAKNAFNSINYVNVKNLIFCYNFLFSAYISIAIHYYGFKLNKLVDKSTEFQVAMHFLVATLTNENEYKYFILFFFNRRIIDVHLLLHLYTQPNIRKFCIQLHRYKSVWSISLSKKWPKSNGLIRIVCCRHGVGDIL